MNYKKLKELMNLLEENSEKFEVELMIVNDEYVSIYFKNDNKKAMYELESYWNFKCEMHSSNSTYVNFYLN